MRPAKAPRPARAPDRLVGPQGLVWARWSLRGPDPNSPPPRTGPTEGIGRFRGSYRGPGGSAALPSASAPGTASGRPWGLRPGRTEILGPGWERSVGGGRGGGWRGAGSGRGGGAGAGHGAWSCAVPRTSFLSGPDANETDQTPSAPCAASSERGFVNRGSGTSHPTRPPAPPPGGCAHGRAPGRTGARSRGSRVPKGPARRRTWGGGGTPGNHSPLPGPDSP